MATSSANASGGPAWRGERRRSRSTPSSSTLVIHVSTAMGWTSAHAMPGSQQRRQLARIPDIPRVWISMSRPSRTRSMT